MEVIYVFCNWKGFFWLVKVLFRFGILLINKRKKVFFLEV